MIQLTKDDTEWEGMDSSGKRTATRYMVFSYDSGDTSMTLAQSALVPSLTDVHPDYTLWTVESIDQPVVNETPKEMYLRVKYVYGGTNVSGALSGKKPWELGATNFQTTTYEKEVPKKRIYQPKEITVGWDENGLETKGTGKWVDYKNSAGFKKRGKDTVTIMRMSFTLNYKHEKGKIIPAPLDYSFNAAAVKICNYNMPAYAAKLMPFSTTLHTVYSTGGTSVKYEYESADVVIELMLEDTWIDWMLNTGTLVLWEQTINGKKKMVPGAVYKYSEIDTYNATTFPTDLLKAPIKFGSLEQMIAQRQKFIKKAGAANASFFPYEEFTEEVPMKMDGTLYSEALLEPEKHEYPRIGGFSRKGASWSKYNFPEKR